jgi:hypothetical protein
MEVMNRVLTMDVCMVNTIISHSFEWGFLCKGNSWDYAHRPMWFHVITFHGRVKYFLTFIDDLFRKTYL